MQLEARFGSELAVQQQHPRRSADRILRIESPLQLKEKNPLVLSDSTRLPNVVVLQWGPVRT